MNALLAPGSGPSIAELTEAGVRRISVGGGLARTAHAAVQRATRDLLSGDDGSLREGYDHVEMQKLIAKRCTKAQ